MANYMLLDKFQLSHQNKMGVGGLDSISEPSSSMILWKQFTCIANVVESK